LFTGKVSRTWVTLLAAMTASAVSAEPRPLTLFSMRDVFALKGVAETRVSPNGHVVAYEALDTDIMIDGRRRSIRLVDTDGTNDRLLADDASTPRWSPDGRSLLYVVPTRTGGTRLMLANIDGKPPYAVADLDGSPSGMAWSSDQQHLAFAMFVPTPAPMAVTPVARPDRARWAAPIRVIDTVRYEQDGQSGFTAGHTQLFTMALAGGRPKQLTTAPLEVNGEPVWTRDGRGLIYAAENVDAFGPDFHAARLYRIAATGGPTTPLTPVGLSVDAPALSPDGQHLAFTAFAIDGRDFSPRRLHVMDVNGQHDRRLGDALDRDFSTPTWASDGRTVYAGYVDRSTAKVRRMAFDGSASDEVATGLGGDFTLARDGTIAYPAAMSDRPADVAVRVPGAPARILTHRNDTLLDGRRLGLVRPLDVRSSVDGASVGAWLTLPASYVPGKHYPLILDVHGGPYGYDGPVWRTRDQLYAAAGYAVLHANYRGSTSYGFAFADRIAHDPLAPSYADLMSAVDAAVATGIVDGARLYVTGGSLGGELTAWIVGSTGRFRAAVAEKPIVNPVSQALTSDQYFVPELVAGPKPWETTRAPWTVSPLALVGRVTTPTMVIVGEEDRRTPVSEAKQLYDALILRRVPTKLVIVPDAGHASIGARPSQLIGIVDLTLKWFAHFDPTAAADQPQQ
jgi:dipeptidyl aminopeptidase/acylaminoacyl peptidase